MLRRLPASQTLHVSELDYDEAPELLLKSARLNVSSTDYRAQASAIVAELGYLALAIDQAGAYIASGECYLDDFLDVFNEHRQHLLENEAYRGASGSDRAVYATWDLSYAAIDRQVKAGPNEALRQGPRAALQILRILPFFHNEGIMEDIFRFAAENSNGQIETECKADDGFPSFLLCCRPDGRWESQSFRQGVQTLLSFSLIGPRSSGGRFLMHRLVHLWAYDRLTEAEKGRFCGQARDILEKSIAWRFASSDYAFRRALLPHITTSLHRSNLSSMIPQKEGIAEFALAFREAGRWKEAEELQVQEMETTKGVLGEEHPNTLSIMNSLAFTYWNQERWIEAEMLQVQVVEITKRVLGEEHPDMLTSMNNLASIYCNQGRWTEAEKLQVQEIEITKRVLGEEHPDTLISMNNLALIYGNQERWIEAEMLQVQVIEMIKRVQGEEHPDTLISMGNLACILNSQSRYKEAISLMKRCLELRKQVLGPNHPDTESSFKFLHKWQGREDKP
ncbi:MAG: hypothetical protein LQ341_004411 [Variospora aurantia]|nr:MAG: hypothetical protein LQ341_004411 [Variospora aurantia]